MSDTADILDDDAFFAIEAEFDPSFARHYVLKEEEALGLAKLLEIEPAPRLQRRELHFTVAMFIEMILASPRPPERAVRRVSEAILEKTGAEAAKLFAGDVSDDPAIRGAVVAYRSLVPDGEPFATVVERKSCEQNLQEESESRRACR